MYVFISCVAQLFFELAVISPFDLSYDNTLSLLQYMRYDHFAIIKKIKNSFYEDGIRVHTNYRINRKVETYKTP